MRTSRRRSPRTPAIQQIASSPNAFFNKPSAGQLKTIFTDIAADLQRGTSALIDESVE